MTESQSRFNARYISTWSPDRLYRVCLVEEEIYFIRIGGQEVMGQVIGAQFGLIGMFIQKGMAKRGEKKLQSLLEQLDSQHPSELLSSHKHNFRCSVRDLVRSRIEPPSRFASHGEHFGRWILDLAGQDSMTFQFETLEEMQEAYSSLPGILGSRLMVNAKWDSIKNRFVHL